MSRPLSVDLREKWDAFLLAEGGRLGLADCRPFLENKMVNDIFYEGVFKGRPCIVKCSSCAPDSIRNEYEKLRELHGIAPTVFPEPYLLCESNDGRLAFVVMEKLCGTEVSDVAGDLVAIADALEKTGIVHRDILNNLLPGRDGHLKLFDFQFAVNRRNYAESPYMIRHWKYLYTIFGVQKSLKLGVWNDCTELLIALKLYGVPPENMAYGLLKRKEPSMVFAPPIPTLLRIRIFLYYISLGIQLPFAKGNKRLAIFRRMETIASMWRK